MRKMQRKRDTLVLTLIIDTIAFSICLLNKVEATTTTAQYAVTSSESTTGIVSTQQEATVASSDTATQSVAGIASTQQGTTVMTAQSTTGLTSTITTGQTTTLSQYIQPPNFGAAPPFKIAFTIGFNKTWTNDLGHPFTDEYRSFKYKVDQEIDKAFQGCPGYIPYSANVIRFYSVNDIVGTRQKVRSLMLSEGVPTLQVTDDNVHAEYQTSFDNIVIIEGGDATTKFIENLTIPRLSSVSIDGSVSVLQSSLTDMTNTARASVSGLQSNPCQAIGAYICTLCYPCSSTKPTIIICLAKCRDDNKVCTVTGSNTTRCNCKIKYLPVGDGCVHENVIIGATAGVGGAVLLGLVIAVFIRCCKREKTESQQMSHEPEPPYEMLKVETVNNAATVEGEYVELVTGAQNQNGLAKANSNGPGPITTERTSSVSSYDVIISSSSDRRPPQP